jgi:superoxide dismutase, Cu-Zn family
MTRTMGVVVGGALLMVAACGPAPAPEQARPRSYVIPAYDAAGQQVASVTLTQQGRDSVRVAVATTRVAAGVHGVHLHAVGRCEGPQFTSAGPHLNPSSRQHGFRNQAGPHLGDMPNMTVAASGQGTLETTVAGSLTPGVAPLFDADGTSLVIHASADDYVTDPSGNSGNRIACAVIAVPTT